MFDESQLKERLVKLRVQTPVGREEWVQLVDAIITINDQVNFLLKARKTKDLNR